jgi:hypothetical protein
MKQSDLGKSLDPNPQAAAKSADLTLQAEAVPHVLTSDSAG